MVRVITSLERLPAEAAPYAERIEKFGFTWRYNEEYGLVAPGKRVQVRTITSVAPPREVSKYAQDLKRGDVMPPVIVTADGYLVDGATRTEAARSIGWKRFPAFILDVVYEQATAEQRHRVTYLGAAFNLTHGRGMNTANLLAIMEDVATDDDTPSSVAMKLHIPVSTATTMLNSVRARRRAERLGVAVSDRLTNSHLKLFGGKANQLTDPVFAGVLKLAQDAGLSIAATTALTKRVQAKGTERERLDLLKTERAGYRDMIHGGETRPSKAAKVRQHLGYIIGEENPELLVEMDPTAAGPYREQLVSAAKMLAQVIEAQIRTDDARRRGE